MKAKRFQRVVAGFLAFASVIGLGCSALAVDANVKQPGEEGFVNLTQFIQETATAGVYKVYLSVGAVTEAVPADILIIMDNSASMNMDASGTDIVGMTPPTTGPVAGTRWDWATTGANNAINIFWNEGMNPGHKLTRVGAMGFGDTSLSYTTLAGYTSPEFTAINGGVYGITPAPDGFLEKAQWADLENRISTLNNAPLGTGTGMGYAMIGADSMFTGAQTEHHITGEDKNSYGAGYGGSAADYDKNVKKFIVFLSDGADTTGTPDAIDYATYLKDKAGFNVEIYTIGLSLSNSLNPDSAGYANWNKRAPVAAQVALHPDQVTYTDEPAWIDPALRIGGYSDIPGDQYPLDVMGDTDPAAQLIYMSMKINRPYTLGDILNTYHGGTGAILSNPFDFNLSAGGTPVTSSDSVVTNIVNTYGAGSPPSFAYGGWTGDTGADEVGEYYNRDTWTKQMPHFYQAHDEKTLEDAFEEIARKIICFGYDVNVGANINLDQFELYTGMAEAPKGYILSGMDGQSVSLSGGKLSWKMDAIPSMGVNSLVLYVKVKTGSYEAGKSYYILNNLGINYVDDKYFFDGNGFVVDTSVSKDFPASFVDPTQRTISNSNAPNLNDSEGSVVNTEGTVAVSPIGMTGVTDPYSDVVLTRHQSSTKKIVITSDKANIYQKTTSGKYKAIASTSKDKTFTVLNEDDDYYKISFKKKGAEKASVGYMKKSDAKILEADKSQNIVSSIDKKALQEAQATQQQQAVVTTAPTPTSSANIG